MLNRLMGIVPNAAEHGYQIDLMLEFCHWFMLILFVGWSAFLLFTLIRFHRSRNPKADYYGVRTHASTHVEFMVVLVEAVLLLGFALPLWAKRVNDFPKPTDNPLVIKVIGQQFAWNFWYPGADGKFGKPNPDMISPQENDPDGKDDILSPGELHLPVNRSVILEITSRDVIHSLSLHSMRITQDAIPGSKFPAWFKPVRTGEYEIVCAQLCGMGHANMKAMMIVQTQEEFDAWVKQNGPQPVPAPAPAPAAPAK